MDARQWEKHKHAHTQIRTQGWWTDVCLAGSRNIGFHRLSTEGNVYLVRDRKSRQRPIVPWSITGLPMTLHRATWFRGSVSLSWGRPAQSESIQPTNPGERRHGRGKSLHYENREKLAKWKESTCHQSALCVCVYVSESENNLFLTKIESFSDRQFIWTREWTWWKFWTGKGSTM